MNPAWHQSTTASARVADEPQLNIVLAYEDYVTGIDAIRTLSRLVQRTGLPHEFGTQNVWKFETLAALALRNIAASEAASADLVIIAAHGPDPLPVAVTHWIELWLGQRGTSPAALVALLDGANGDTDELFPMETYLEKCARRGGMDFFVKKVGERMAVDDYDFTAIGEKAEQTSEALEQILRRPRGPRAGFQRVGLPSQEPDERFDRGLELASRPACGSKEIP